MLGMPDLKAKSRVARSVVARFHSRLQLGYFGTRVPLAWVRFLHSEVLPSQN